MDVALVRIRERAPDDVRQTVDQLLADGWAIEGSRGPEAESFGDLFLTLATDDLAVTVVSDRGQWSLAIRVADGTSYPLHVVISARDATEPSWPDRGPSDQLPEQLPTGVSWVDALELCIPWLRQAPDAIPRLVESQEAWQTLALRRLS